MQEPLHISTADTGLFEERIRCSRRIGIVTHTRPDGDAVGSCLALLRAVDALDGCAGKCRILLDTPAPDAVRFLFSPGETARTTVCSEDPEALAAYVAQCDLLVFQDLNRLERSGGMEAALSASPARRILVDHHLDPQRERFGLCFSDTGVSSTCELLYQVLVRFPAFEGKGLPAGCPDPLLTGITTDTNNFANSVSGRTLETVSALLAAGADRERILEQVYQTYPERRIRLLGHLLDRELVITEQGVALMALDAETIRQFGITEGETEGFVNIPLAVDRVRMSLFLKQDGDEYRVSIRSKKGWSANRLATRWFAGGGHEQASGGKIPLNDRLKDKDDVVAWVLQCTRQFLSDEN